MQRVNFREKNKLFSNCKEKGSRNSWRWDIFIRYLLKASNIGKSKQKKCGL